jgi:hypothetical protein
MLRPPARPAAGMTGGRRMATEVARYAILGLMNLQDIQHALRHAAVDVRTAGIGVDALTGWGRLDVGKAVGNTFPLGASEDAWVDNSQKNQNFGSGDRLRAAAGDGDGAGAGRCRAGCGGDRRVVPRSPGCSRSTRNHEVIVGPLSKMSQNFGSGDRLRVDGQDPRRIVYLKFDLRNVAAHQGATLRVCSRENATSGGGGKVYLVDPAAWGESTVTWNNRPALGSVISGSIREPVYGNVPAGTCLSADLTPHVRPKQINSFAIAKDNDSADGLAYFSREGAGATDKGPHLVLTTCQPTGCRTCNGATVVEANAQLLPLALSVVLYKLHDRRRRKHADRSRPRVC